MKPTRKTYSFEINICNIQMPTAAIAVFQLINTLTSGDILKVSACSKNTASALIRFCKNNDNTLLQKQFYDDEVTLFFKKN